MWVPSLGREDPLEKEVVSLGNPMDRGAWWATVLKGRKESDTTERLNNNVGDERGGQVAAGGRQLRKPPGSHPSIACISHYSHIKEGGGPRLIFCSTVGFAPLYGCVGPGLVVPWASSSVGPHPV